MSRAMFRPLLAAALVMLALGSATAQQRGRPGDFDFWVLVLSWSPSWCEAEGDGRNAVECARPYSFTVHGLWPQYNRGYPSDCDATARDPSREAVNRILDIMPSPGLIRHEWRKHGTCSGLAGDAYLNIIDKLYSKIKIPDAYKQPDKPQMVSPAKVEADFLAANSSILKDAIAVTCDGKRLREVRICLSKKLDSFQPCPDVDNDQCRSNQVFLPSVRGK